MNTNYADAVCARSKSRQSPPASIAIQRPLPAAIKVPTSEAGDQTQGSNGVAMETESNTSNLTTQGQGLTLGINLTKPSEGESLPEGYSCNYAGFLIKTRKKRIHVSEELVAAEERFLQDHLIVASFIEGRPSPASFNTWLANLNIAITGGTISHSGDLGWGFTCLKASSQDVARQALVLTPCRIGSSVYSSDGPLALTPCLAKVCLFLHGSLLRNYPCISLE